MKRKGISIILLCTVVVSLLGCAIRRDLTGDEDQDMQMAKIFQIERKGVELDKIIETFLEMTPQEAVEYSYNGVCEVNNVRLSLGNCDIDEESLSSDKEVTFVSYENENEGAFSCYSLVCLGEILECLNSSISLRQNFPEEELESCSREEAIEACRPYAEACGYVDTDVSAYAITLEFLEEYANKYDSSAPGPGFEMLTTKEFSEAGKRLLALEEGTEEYEKAAKEYDLLMERRHDGATHMRDFPWQKEHEVILLTYQQHWDGYDTGEVNDYLKILYAPLYEKPVWVQGRTTYEVTGVVEEVPIISRETAIESLLLLAGYESLDEIEIQEMDFRYQPQSTAETEMYERKLTAIPCWDIKYLDLKDNIRMKAIINAQFGDAYYRYPEY